MFQHCLDHDNIIHLKTQCLSSINLEELSIKPYTVYTVPDVPNVHLLYIVNKNVINIVIILDSST